MTDGLASLHKILKDKTRRTIILLLTDKGNLSYTELLNALKPVSTGKLNYHLKILSSLISKRVDGQYVLTEKGGLASRMLLEFAEEDGQSIEMKTRWGWAKVESVVKKKILVTAAGILTIIAACLSGIIGIIGGIAGITLETALTYHGHNIVAFFMVTIFGFTGFGSGITSSIFIFKRRKFRFSIICLIILMFSVIISVITMSQSRPLGSSAGMVGGLPILSPELHSMLWMSPVSWCIITVLFVLPTISFAVLSLFFIAENKNMFF